MFIVEPKKNRPKLKFPDIGQSKFTISTIFKNLQVFVPFLTTSQLTAQKNISKFELTIRFEKLFRFQKSVKKIIFYSPPEIKNKQE